MNHPIVEFIKRHVFFILGGVCLVVVGIIYIVGRGSGAEVIRGSVVDAGEDEAYVQAYVPAPEPALAIVPEPTPEPEPSYIIVHIVGAVNSPGVFTLPEGARVDDVLQLAGGENEYADLARINLAAVLRDAMQIIVPAVGEEVDEVFIFADDMGSAASGGVQDSTNAGVQNQSDGLININTATSIQLQALPGIGPVLAQNIIDFRESHGNFSSVDELIHVSRIGPATLDRIRTLVTIG